MLFRSDRRTGRRFKTAEYRAFEKLVNVELLRSGKIALMHAIVNKPYRLNVELLAPSWRCKNGVAKKLDAANYIKAVEDVICAAAGWRDEYCVQVTATKAIGEQGCCRVIFEFFDDSALT